MAEGRRQLRWIARLGLVVLFVLTLSAGAAAESVASLTKKLLGDDDFRVRTQAALALGASGKKAAVSPLCKGLGDSSDTVRAASAAGLGRLAKGGKSCLEARQKKEKNNNVSKMIAKAIRLIDEAAAGPSLGPSSKHYVALLPPKVIAERKKDIAAVVNRAFRRAASQGRGIVVAPDAETTNQAKKRLRKYPHVLGWALQPTLRVEYDGTQLVVRIDMDILAYPEKQSQGSLTQRSGMGGMNGKDEAKEDELVEQVSKDAFDKFVDMAQQVN